MGAAGAIQGLIGRRIGIGEVFDFWNTVRELNFETIDREANLITSIGVVGDRDLRERLIETLQSGAAFGPGSIVLQGIEPDMADSDQTLHCHLLLYIAPPDAPRTMLGEWSRRARRDVPRLLILAPRSGYAPVPEGAGAAFWGDVVLLPRLDPAELGQRLGPAIISILPGHALALARHLPIFRPAVSRWIVESTSRVNLEFALASNLPALIPVIGNLMSASVDLLVLTKNQVFMVYRLGVIHGRDTRQKLRVFGEIAPVVGAAFGWRTLARELSALLPGLIGAVPKVAIAYSGTYAIGRMAEYYYRLGHKPPASLSGAWYREAITRIKNMLPLPGRGQKQLPAGARHDDEERVLALPGR